MTSLSLSNIKKHFGRVDVIRGVDLSVDDGEFVVANRTLEAVYEFPYLAHATRRWR